MANINEVHSGSMPNGGDFTIFSSFKDLATDVKQPVSFTEITYLYNAEKNINNNQDVIKDIVGENIYELIKEFSGIDNKRLNLYKNPNPQIEQFYKSIIN